MNSLMRRLERIGGGRSHPVVLRIIEPTGTSETERETLIADAKAQAGYPRDYDGDDLLVILRTIVAPQRVAA